MHGPLNAKLGSLKLCSSASVNGVLQRRGAGQVTCVGRTVNARSSLFGRCEGKRHASRRIQYKSTNAHFLNLYFNFYVFYVFRARGFIFRKTVVYAVIIWYFYMRYYMVLLHASVYVI